MQLTSDQLDFLKLHNFHLIQISENTKYPYVHGRIGKNYPEFYNINSVEQLIEEIKVYGKPLEDANAIQFKSVPSEFFRIEFSKIKFIDQRLNKTTGLLEIDHPIRKTFSPQIKRIFDEDDEKVLFVSRYTGDMGDGSQFLECAYKSYKAALKNLIPALLKQKIKFTEQVKLIDQLITEET